MIQHQDKKCCGIFGFIFGHKFEVHYLESQTIGCNEGETYFHKFPHSAYCLRCGTLVDLPFREDGDDYEDDSHNPMFPIEDRVNLN